MINTRNILAVFALFLLSPPLLAAEFTLRLHQMLPAQGTVPSKVLQPWANKIESESNGRIKVELYHAMELGGTPADLLDQAAEGTVDLTWTLFGYTPERYPKAEVFELPFMVTNATATSMAFQEYFETYMRHDASLKDLHVLAVHTHGPGLINTRDRQIKHLRDLNRLKLRGTSRVVNAMLMSLGAKPVWRPVTDIPIAMQNKSIDGSVVPFEVVPILKIQQYAPFYTGFSGARGIYTGTFVFAMNEQRYQSLPPELKKVIDHNSGIDLARQFGAVMDDGDLKGRDIAVKAGNSLFVLDEEQTKIAHEVSDQVIEEWLMDMDARGFNGRKLYQAAQQLIKKYTKQNSQ